MWPWHHRCIDDPTAQVMRRLIREVIMKWPSWVNVVIGIWLIIAPFLIGFAHGVAMQNSVIVGIIVLIAALYTISVKSASFGASWLNLIVGVWLMISPWVLRFSTTARPAVTSSVVCGILVLIFAWIRVGLTKRLPVA